MPLLLFVPVCHPMPVHPVSVRLLGVLKMSRQVLGIQERCTAANGQGFGGIGHGKVCTSPTTVSPKPRRISLRDLMEPFRF